VRGLNSFIIGTAGHIDHGKTALIRALTDHEGDRLKEEKERGITIDLGFTSFTLEDGEKAGIIDVPGHEKFLKNMLSGASSISIVLLVIAADEGIMPQTVEHFNILSFLDIEKALVVLTKTDRVSEEMISLRKAEIQDYFKGTAYEGIEIHPVSSVTCEGIEELKKGINEIYRELAGKKAAPGSFRLSVDRVFNSRGFGTVVTGTVIGGMVRVNDTLELHTSDGTEEVRVRGIQVHEETRTAASKGQRCALNLARIATDEIHRGDVLAEKGLLKESHIIDCTLLTIRDFDHDLKERQRIRLYHGTREVLGRIHLISEPSTEGLTGEMALNIQVRLEGKLHALKGDRYVLRNYSPMYLIGGGTIINPHGRKFRPHDRSSYLLQESTMGPDDGTSVFIHGLDHEKRGILLKKEVTDTVMRSAVEESMKKEALFELSDVYLTRNALMSFEKELKTILTSHFERFPLRASMKKEEARLKLKDRFSQRDFVLLLSRSDSFVLQEDAISLTGRTVTPGPKDLELAGKILKLLGQNPLIPEDPRKLPEASVDRERYQEVMVYLKDKGEILILDEIVFLRSAIERAKKVVIDEIGRNGKIDIKTAREQLESTRKYVVPLLEYFDREKVTKRDGDARVLYR
jgi:selenocysteine-specific elongation factor